MNAQTSCEMARSVVRRNNEEVLGRGNFKLFDELFADDFVDHTPPPGFAPNKYGVRELYRMIRSAFPDFYAEIHWQLAAGDCVTTYKTYHGTHRGDFLGVISTSREVQFEAMDVIRVCNGKLSEHWGVANLFSVMQQLGAWGAAPQAHYPTRTLLWKTNPPWQLG
jgi:predicted ester cyclase